MTTGHAGPDDALGRLVRALEVGLGDRVDPAAGRLTAEERTADEAALVARVRELMAEPSGAVERRHVGLREVCLGLVRSGVVPVLTVLLVLVAALPRSATVLLLLFAVAPLALLAKWSSEAYRGAELDRHGARLRERSAQFRRASRRLDALVGAIDAEQRARPRSASDLVGQKVADLRTAVVAVRAEMTDVTRRLHTGGRRAQAFVADWPSNPEQAFTLYPGGVGTLEPGAVAAVLTDLHARLHLLGPMAADVALAAGGSGAGATFGGLSPGALATELGDIYQEVSRARRPIVEECRRLWSSFDTVHRSAARQFLHARIRRPSVRTAALAVLDVRSLSTWSPQVRTRQRAVYLASVNARPQPTFGDIGRAAGAMLRVG